MVGALAEHRLKAAMNYLAIYAVIFLSMAAGCHVLTRMSSYDSALVARLIGGLAFGLYIPNHRSGILALLGPGRRGLGVGLVTTAMFLNQFLAPILAEPLIDPADPRAAWRGDQDNTSSARSDLRRAFPRGRQTGCGRLYNRTGREPHLS
jgi:MFS family permease